VNAVKNLLEMVDKEWPPRGRLDGKYNSSSRQKSSFLQNVAGIWTSMKRSLVHPRYIHDNNY
jgi:hypothetical protein